jgi:DNA-binding CsgD family transcriptional regulator
MIATPTSELSDRELEILKLLATGASNKDIARQLVISPNTVKVHLRNIFSKIGAVSRTEATLYAIREGLVAHPAASMNGGAPPAQLWDQPLPAALPVGAAELWEHLGRYRWLATIVLVFLFLATLGGLTLAVERLTPPPTSVAQNNQPGPTFPPRWQALASLPMARSGLGAAAYGNDIYAIAGETASGVTGDVARYTPAEDAWQPAAPKPVAVTDVQAALLGEKIYVPGGRLASGQPTDLLEVYDPRRNAWEQRASLPAPRSAYALAAFEGKLYLFGGWDGAKPVATVYEYDPAVDAWRALSALPTARMFAGAAAVTGKIFVVGGYDGKQALETVLSYYPERDGDGENPWEMDAPLPAGRYAMGIISLADTVYLVGGKVSDPTPLAYTVQSDQWTPFENPPKAAGWGLALTGLQNMIYALGGEEGDPARLAGDNLRYQALYTIMIPGLSH